jgi:predicted lactoylglutathione lyase
VEQRVSLITLAVADIAKAKGFYEALGWKNAAQQDGIVAFDLIGASLGLYPWENLARDMGLDPSVEHAPRMTLSHNVRSRDEVDALFARACDIGARDIKKPHEVFWGGYIAYFADLDGHIWEIAHNPYSELGPDGVFRWNGY